MACTWGEIKIITYLQGVQVVKQFGCLGVHDHHGKVTELLHQVLLERLQRFFDFVACFLVDTLAEVELHHDWLALHERDSVVLLVAVDGVLVVLREVIAVILVGYLLVIGSVVAVGLNGHLGDVVDDLVAGEDNLFPQLVSLWSHLEIK
jgi:hypothetical protein